MGTLLRHSNVLMLNLVTKYRADFLDDDDVIFKKIAQGALQSYECPKIVWTHLGVHCAYEMTFIS